MRGPPHSRRPEGSGELRQRLSRGPLTRRSHSITAPTGLKARATARHPAPAPRVSRRIARDAANRDRAHLALRSTWRWTSRRAPQHANYHAAGPGQAPSKYSRWRLVSRFAHSQADDRLGDNGVARQVTSGPSRSWQSSCAAPASRTSRASPKRSYATCYLNGESSRRRRVGWERAGGVEPFGGGAGARDGHRSGARLSMLLVRPDALWRRRPEVALGCSPFMPSDRLSADDRRGNHLRIP